MLKETEETIVFFVTFLSLVAIQLGGGGGGPPLATLMQGRVAYSFVLLCNRCGVEDTRLEAGAPRAKRGPGVSSNITHLRFCEQQNGRERCHSFVRILM